MSPACNRMSNNSVKFLQFITGNVIGLFPADDKAGFSRFIDNCWLIHDFGSCRVLLIPRIGDIKSSPQGIFLLGFGITLLQGLVLLYCRLNLDQLSLEHPC